MKRAYTFLIHCFFFFVILCLMGLSFFAPSWRSINSDIAKKFPEVQNISTDNLAEILGKEEVFLIDVRQPEEFAVSNIKGAVNIESPEDVTSPHDNRIVVYCSVGYRSAKFASKLQQAGYARVYNVHGSIFEWANKGYPLYQGSNLTHYVHPYDSNWGKLLNEKFHSYTPVAPTEETGN